MLMDSEDHTITIHGAPTSFFYKEGFLFRGSEASCWRSQGSIGHPVVGEGWECGEKQLRGEPQNVTFKPAEKTGTCSSERVDGVGVRLRRLISRAAPRWRRPLPSERTGGPPPLNVNSGLGSGLKGVPLLTSRATTQFVLRSPTHPRRGRCQPAGSSLQRKSTSPVLNCV